MSGQVMKLFRERITLLNELHHITTKQSYERNYRPSNGPMVTTKGVRQKNLVKKLAVNSRKLNSFKDNGMLKYADIQSLLKG